VGDSEVELLGRQKNDRVEHNGVLEMGLLKTPNAKRQGRKETINGMKMNLPRTSLIVASNNRQCLATDCDIVTKILESNLLFWSKLYASE
jgi:hypothetical protein